MKLCECGCGGAAPIAKMTNTKWGHVKGEPVRFIRGHHNFRLRRPLAARFWAKVEKRGADDCWLWQGATARGGYGAIGVGGARGGITRAHRLAYELTNGPLPEGEGYHGTCVLHRCDTPLCCNPRHLFLGTQADNMADKTAKGRVPKGEQHSRAKLTEADVRTIREWAPAGWRHVDLAAAFGVSRSLISLVLSRQIWAHV